MFESFTVELTMYALVDIKDLSKIKVISTPAYTRFWSDPGENLTYMYEHILENAANWQAREKHHGSRVEIVEEDCRLTLIEFPPEMRRMDDGRNH